MRKVDIADAGSQLPKLVEAALAGEEVVITLEQVRQMFGGNTPRGEWDIYLTTSSEYKVSARSDYAPVGLNPLSSLLVDLPRFVWRVTLRESGRIDLDFLFDATGIATDNLLVHAVAGGGPYAQMVALLSTTPLGDQVKVTQACSVLKLFKAHADAQAQQAGQQ